MGIWKGRKKKKQEPLTQRCPRCLNSNLRYSSGFSGIFSLPKFLCPDCGYDGAVYVDVAADDKNEAKTLSMLREEFPDLVEEQKSAQELATLCLEEKWLPNQAENHNSLREWCPFCADVNVVCSICKCPPIICAKHATEGYIGQLNDLYDDETELCAVDSEIYHKIVIAFQQIVQKSSL